MMIDKVLSQNFQSFTYLPTTTQTSNLWSITLFQWDGGQLLQYEKVCNLPSFNIEPAFIILN